MNACLGRRRLLRVGVRTALIAAGAAAAMVPAGAVTDLQLDASLGDVIAPGEPRVVAGGSPHSFDVYRNEAVAFDSVDLRAFHDSIRIRLPRFRPFIRDAAGRNGFDWCLIAAQIYQESRFDPAALGPNGAQGLMQILPSTARSLKVANPLDPVASIKGGVAYLKWLYDLYDGADETNRLLTALAAYNAGPGHVNDARRLAARMGLDPTRWESLSRTLPLLRLRRYYQEAEQGFCRGDITVAYVRQIMTYYDILKRRELDTAIAKAGTTERAAVH